MTYEFCKECGKNGITFENLKKDVFDTMQTTIPHIWNELNYLALGPVHEEYIKSIIFKITNRRDILYNSLLMVYFHLYLLYGEKDSVSNWFDSFVGGRKNDDYEYAPYRAILEKNRNINRYNNFWLLKTVKENLTIAEKCMDFLESQYMDLHLDACEIYKDILDVYNVFNEIFISSPNKNKINYNDQILLKKSNLKIGEQVLQKCIELKNSVDLFAGKIESYICILSEAGMIDEADDLVEAKRGFCDSLNKILFGISGLLQEKIGIEKVNFQNEINEVEFVHLYALSEYQLFERMDKSGVSDYNSYRNDKFKSDLNGCFCKNAFYEDLKHMYIKGEKPEPGSTFRLCLMRYLIEHVYRIETSYKIAKKTRDLKEKREDTLYFLSRLSKCSARDLNILDSRYYEYDYNNYVYGCSTLIDNCFGRSNISVDLLQDAKDIRIIFTFISRMITLTKERILSEIDEIARNCEIDFRNNELDLFAEEYMNGIPYTEKLEGFGDINLGDYRILLTSYNVDLSDLV